MIRLIVGLGNPGLRFTNTRHNVGFMFIDSVVSKWGEWLEETGKGILGKISIDSNSVFILKPFTYMNRSGEAIPPIVKRFSILPEEILVVYDDLWIPLGSVRIRIKGSSGGHNGMQSIIEALGTENIPRLRIGIGPLPEGISSVDFVLSEFSEEELKILEKTIESTLEGLPLIVTDIEKAMSRYNKRIKG
ncbi:MAG: aminoacyl-tRNA hydrolase [bacterium]|nr:aminoacyl-tRNA hydrolase [bacterium]